MPYNPYSYTNVPVQPVNTPMAQMPSATYNQMPYINQQPQQPEQLMNGGLIVVPTEEDVKRYPVAPGNLVTFRIENQPVIIEKSMGRSQFASPQYERYKLSKEDAPEVAVEKEIIPEKSNTEFAEIKKSIEHIDVQIDILKDNYADLARSIKALNKKSKEEDE